MDLKVLPGLFSVCKILSLTNVDWRDDFCFVGKTDEELSLVCRGNKVPLDATEREDGWRGFKICGVLDFSLVGILAQIADTLAKNNISIFAVSTYNTDYVFVKEDRFYDALTALNNVGYNVV